MPRKASDFLGLELIVGADKTCDMPSKDDKMTGPKIIKTGRLAIRYYL